MIDSLITSRTRIKLLLKFFLNPNSTSYLRGLETEFGESTNAIRLELNRFEKAKLLKSKFERNKKFFIANTKHPLYPDINSIILKHTGLDQVIERVAKKVGDIKEVYITGDIAKGRNAKILDIIFIGDDIERVYLLNLVEKAEKIIKRKIRFIIYTISEFSEIKPTLKPNETLLLWST